MAKRFTDTEKWADPWFCSLSPDQKFFWIYITDVCDIAGYWKVNFPLLKFNTGISPDKNFFIPFKYRITKVNEELWFINKFIKFQQGVDISSLNPDNKAHKGILNRLSSYPIENKHELRGLEGASEELSSSPSIGIGIGNGKCNKDRGVGKGKTEHQLFVENFGYKYTEKTGQPFKPSTKDFVIATKLIKTYGIEAVEQKVNVLAIRCESCDIWFTKDSGWASFTIGKLSQFWNELIPQVKMTEQEIKDKRLLEGLRKLEERDAELEKKYGPIRGNRSRTGVGAPVPVSGQTTIGRQEELLDQ